MMRLCCALFVLLLWAGVRPAMATPIIADISDHRIEIFSGFSGTHLLLFGARNASGDIVVVIRGTEKNMVVRQKKRKAGIWVNRKEARFETIPHYYAVATSRPIEEVQHYNLLQPLQLYDAQSIEKEPFRQAMVRILTQQELYSLTPQPIEFMGETLFKASFFFPDNIPRGTYTAEVYLFSDGVLSGMQTIPLEIYKTGFDAFLYDNAQHHGLLYGLAALALAMSLGGMANWLFRRI